MPDASDSESLAEAAHGSTSLDVLARAGLLGYGVVHILIGVLALRLALGGRTKSDEAVSTGGALEVLTETPVGTGLLWVLAGSLFGLAVWQVLEAVVERRGETDPSELASRWLVLIKAAIYLALGYSAAGIAASQRDPGDSGSRKAEALTDFLLGLPLGTLLVGLIGIAIAAYAIREAHHGVSGGFREELDHQAKSGHVGRGVLLLGKVGLVGKSLALLLVSWLFLRAAATGNKDSAGGTDEALRRLLDEPFGPAIVTSVGLGLILFGTYCLIWARYRTTEHLAN